MLQASRPFQGVQNMLWVGLIVRVASYNHLVVCPIALQWHYIVTRGYPVPPMPDAHAHHVAWCGWSKGKVEVFRIACNRPGQV